MRITQLVVEWKMEYFFPTELKAKKLLGKVYQQLLTFIYQMLKKTKTSDFVVAVLSKMPEIDHLFHVNTFFVEKKKQTTRVGTQSGQVLLFDSIIY